MGLLKTLDRFSRWSQEVDSATLARHTSLEHDVPSRSNPALVLCIVDYSKSMEDSGAHEHVFSAIMDLRSHARAKPQQVWVEVIGFHNGILRIFSNWGEKLERIYQPSGSQTHLKMACDEAVKAYETHVEDRCEGKSPLTNILFFTDGEHTPSLDREWPVFTPGVPGRLTKWAGKTPNEWIAPLCSTSSSRYLKPNILIGVIDYSGDLSEFPEPGYWRVAPSKKFSKASVLEEDVLSKAYLREEANPPRSGTSLNEVLGPMEEKIGKLFIVSSKTILRNPAVTSAFVRLGTSTAFGSGNRDVSTPSDDFDGWGTAFELD